MLVRAGWLVRLEPERGFDHGTFSMLKPIYPNADMPIVQLSMKKDFDPAEHIAVGGALAPLRDEGILVIGSGFSYHNLRAFGPSAARPAATFDRWLRHVVLDASAEDRREALEHWAQAPSAREAHPREDHLIPLMVVAGAAGDDPATAVYGELFMGHLAASSFRFGTDRTATSFDRLAAESGISTTPGQ